MTYSQHVKQLGMDGPYIELQMNLGFQSQLSMIKCLVVSLLELEVDLHVILMTKKKKELVNFMIGCFKIGFAKSRKGVLAITQSLVAKKQGKYPEEVSVTMVELFQKASPPAYSTSSKSFVVCLCCSS